jgi:MarR family transcriptional regulator, organic hydroperoxide resistance regulator
MGLQTLIDNCISAYMNHSSAPPGFGTLLRRLLAELDGDVQAHYDRLGLPFRPRFYPIFRHLLAQESATIGEIAAAIHATQPAATQTVNELKGLGLVAADTGTDRRERSVRLSREGLRLAKELAPLWQAIEQAAAGLDEELPAGLRETLESALSSLEQQPFRDRIDAALSAMEN